MDADCNPILSRSEVYSGVYGRASISFYAFNSNGNKGIACGLNNLQKIRDGEPLGGKASWLFSGLSGPSSTPSTTASVKSATLLLRLNVKSVTPSGRPSVSSLSVNVPFVMLNITKPE